MQKKSIGIWMLTVLYCKKCRSNLLEKGDMICDLYEQLCEHYMSFGKPFEMPDMHFGKIETMIEFLERKGFVVTTETENQMIKVVPKGLNIIDDFCRVCRDVTHNN